MVGRPGRHEACFVILVDSSVWIDYFSGNDSTEADFLDRTLGNRAVAIITMSTTSPAPTSVVL